MATRSHKIVLLGLCLLVVSAWSGRGHAEAGWTAYGKVLELRATTQGRFVFRLRTETNPSECREPHWFYRDYRGLGAEQMYATLLEAASEGHAIRVHVSGVCDLHGYSEVNSVALAGQ